MRSNWRRFAICLWALSSSAVGASVPVRTETALLSYQARLDQAEWHTEASPFRCRLWQPVPDFGDAVFETRAGYDPHFFLAPARNPFQTGRAGIQARAPHWQPDRPASVLGDVEVGEGEHPLNLPEGPARQLLTSLYQGMAPVISQNAWFADRLVVEVALSSAGFRGAYRQYQQCLGQLLPVSFEQIARTRVRFATDQWQLSRAARSQLDLVIRYVQTDSRVKELFVDGHTDDVGRRLHNLELSKKRAEAVAGYLAAAGIDQERITVRYHGERYPVVVNNSAVNRSKNRRVTIRLERG